jgi:hypothetical protein
LKARRSWWPVPDQPPEAALEGLRAQAGARQLSSRRR